ncbi:glycosyltransferase [Thiothrix eikelboomii]|uniref:glycosyltransferase n=1 Tax=Thiothrix eikelboomii TaxID=92487 RepID=UPI003BB17267
MKIALLSSASSIHTVRWANGLNAAGHKVHVITQQPVIDPFDSNVEVHVFPLRGIIGYFTMTSAVKRLLHSLKPDILNAHYASGYGTTARLVNFHPYLLSVWGSDVYEFPYISPLHKYLLQKNLYAADAIASTSCCMAEQTKLLATDLTDIHITPFGIDLEKFKPAKVKKPFDNESIIIGTVKTLSEKYGIEYLIRAFKIVSEKHPNLPLKLLIVGSGNLEKKLKNLVLALNIAEKTMFTGRVPHEEVPIYQNMLDVSVSVSNSESFGVAIIEASACAKPVVVSNVGGLPEVVEDGVTGIIVPPCNPEATANAIEKLILAPSLRENMGQAGRQRVEQLYAWEHNVDHMIGVYESILRKT